MNLATVLMLQHWRGLRRSLYVGVLVWRARQESKTPTELIQ